MRAMTPSVAGHTDRAVGTDHLLDLVYDELRSLAAEFMKREPLAHTLQPTALVHEAYLRMIEQSAVDWKSKAHFFAVASKMIRRVLIDHSRGRNASKRGGSGRHADSETRGTWRRMTLTDSVGLRSPACGHHELDFLALDEALERLRQLSPRQAGVVELRFFGDLTNKEIAHVLNVSRKTVVEDWTMARAWLSRELSGESDSSSQHIEGAAPESGA